jgi:hypothetical protein
LVNRVGDLSEAVRVAEEVQKKLAMEDILNTARVEFSLPTVADAQLITTGTFYNSSFFFRFSRKVPSSLIRQIISYF